MSKIGQIIFFESTYEVEIKLNRSSEWVFLRLSETGELLDGFCSCKKKCAHVEAARSRVCPNGRPWHVLFQRSIFHKLGFLWFQRWPGKSLDELRGELTLKAKNSTAKKLLLEIFPGRPKTQNGLLSFKLASLPAEEAALYLEGKASLDLRFRLSSFGDLARVFFMQEAKVVLTGKELPLKLKLETKALRLEMVLKPEELEALIPLLAEAKSNLKAYPQKRLQAAVFDEKKAELEIVFEPFLKGFAKEAKFKLGSWFFVPEEGFFEEVKDLEPRLVLKDKKAISDYLDGHFLALSPFLSVQKEIKAFKKKLFVDPEGRLHIEAFFEKPGDLAGAFFLHNWMFFKGRGFYRLKEKPLFQVVEKDQVSGFVAEKRLFLQQIEGFEVHFGPFYFQERLSFSLTEDQDLKFEKKLLVPRGFKRVVDFGAWVYAEGKGFYTKKELSFSGLPPLVKKADLASFLSQRKKDLEQIGGFFTEENPLEQAGLKIFLNEKGKITVEPKYILKKDQRLLVEDLIFFGTFVFWKKKGFFELALPFRLPEGYAEKKEISESEESFFVHYELERLRPFILQIDPSLVRPEKLRARLLDLKKEGSSYLVRMVYASSLGEENAVGLKLALLDNKKYLFSRAGLIFLRGERFKWLSLINPKRVLKKRGYLRLKTLEWVRLMVLENLPRPSGKGARDRKMQKLFDELLSMGSEEEPDLGYLKSELRPYQKTGVKWLGFLYAYGLSGFLLDEMGLGKTHQAMGLLALALKKDPLRSKRYLVVCPTSVIYHWEDLLKRFLPEIKVTLFHGLKRKFDDKAELVLTSYGMVRSEQKLLQSKSFEIAIFDEVQIAKNRRSKI
ncbi:MAG: DEAD/DEAH box helicase, partial [Parachlamydiales bacterium]